MQDGEHLTLPHSRNTGLGVLITRNSTRAHNYYASANVSSLQLAIMVNNGPSVEGSQCTDFEVEPCIWFPVLPLTGSVPVNWKLLHSSEAQFPYLSISILSPPNKGCCKAEWENADNEAYRAWHIMLVLAFINPSHSSLARLEHIWDTHFISGSTFFRDIENLQNVWEGLSG